MELEYLKEFSVLAKTLSFSRTAERLFTTQSTISKHLRSLEAELGMPLFVRTNRHVELTEEGRDFLSYAERMLQLQYEYQTYFYNRREAERLTLSIGSIPGMTQYQITDILIHFKKENPNITLEVLEADTQDLKEALLSGQCELAFARDPNPVLPDDFIRIPYCSDRIAAVLPAGHPLAGRQQLSLSELSREDFLLLKKNTALYRQSVEACQAAGFSPHIVFTGERLENIMDLVSKDMGIALLTERQTLRLAPPGISVLPLVPELITNVSLTYKKDRLLSSAALHFIHCVEQTKRC